MCLRPTAPSATGFSALVSEEFVASNGIRGCGGHREREHSRGSLSSGVSG